MRQGYGIGLIVFTALGFVGIARGDERDDRAATILTKLGATVRRDKDGRVTAVHLFPASSKVTDTDFACVENLPALRSVILMDSFLTNASLARLKTLPALDFLMLGGTHTDAQGQIKSGGDGFTDAGLARLSESKGLKHLILAGSKFTDAGLVHVAGLTGIRRLGLSSPGFTDAGLVRIAGLNGLVELNLRGSKITGRTLKDLAILPGLESLVIGPTDLDARSFAAIADLAHLRRLMIYKSKIADDAVPKLARLTWLETLDLTESPLSNAHVSKLKTSLGTTQINIEKKEQFYSKLSKPKA